MGHVYLYYGTGGGKTIASLGLALRSLGHGHRVIIIQFLKHWKKTGEYRAAKTLGPLYEIRQFGKPGWIKSGDEEGEVSVIPPTTVVDAPGFVQLTNCRIADSEGIVDTLGNVGDAFVFVYHGEAVGPFGTVVKGKYTGAPF